ncbi:MAG: UxaA family hydrolase [Proteobacteria bacterium]|nr:UxaA family hydrolase [Pseudomonadota bacterium]
MSDFLGYRNADGSVGVRNHFLVMSLTGLTGPTARRIAQQIRGAEVVTMPFGSGLVGADAELHRRALIGLAANPNVGAVLMIGGNPPELTDIAEAVALTGKPVDTLSMDDCDHDALTLSERGTRAGVKLARAVSRRRRGPASASELTVALECGRSDPSSGLVSNPLVGLVADRLVAAGARVIFGETMEWLGAEHLLKRRAVSPEVARAIEAAVLRREAQAVAAGIDLTGNNPGPTNIAGGLTTIEEKALGGIAKGGLSPIQSLIGIAERPAKPGLHVMDAPAYAPESVTGFVAAGAQLVMFTTGAGNSFVSQLAPTLKLSGNPVATRRLAEQLDFDASAVTERSESIEAAAARLYDTLIDIAGGTLTWGEVLNEGEEVVSRLGPAL